MEQLRALSEEYKIDIIFNVDKEDREAWDQDAYILVMEDHAMIALSPENPRSQIIHTLSERFNKE